MRMLFLGAGGTGGYFGARAAQAGADVTFLLRPARAARLREQGLQVRSPLGDFSIAPKLATADSLRDPYDAIVLSCKGYDLDSAIEAIRPAVGPESVILPIMNGVAHYDVLDQRFGAHRVLGGLCQINAELADDGAVVQLTKMGVFVFGERSGDPHSARVAALANALAPARFDCRASIHILQDIWEKFVFLTSMAAVTCLMRGSVGAILDTGYGEALLRGALAEAQSVAAAFSHTVRPAADAVATKILTERGSPLTASMFRDMVAGKAVEADSIVGDMIARAQTVGVPVPILRIAYSHLEVYQNARRARLARTGP